MVARPKKLSRGGYYGYHTSSTTPSEAGSSEWSSEPTNNLQKTPEKSTQPTNDAAEIVDSSTKTAVDSAKVRGNLSTNTTEPKQPNPTKDSTPPQTMTITESTSGAPSSNTSTSPTSSLFQKMAQMTGDRPHSKTAIARLTYHFKELPKLFVVEVNIFSIMDVPQENDTRQVWNRKLREAALTELLDHERYNNYRRYIAFDTRGRKNNIIVSLHGGNESIIKNLFQEDGHDLDDTRRRIKSPDGRFAYARYGIDHDFFEEVKQPGLNKLDVSDKNEGSEWDLTLRNTPTIDARRRLLHLNYDLDIAIPTNKRVHNILSDILGPDTIIDGEAAHVMAVVQRLLVGLQVRCAYRTPERDAMIRGDKGEVFLKQIDRSTRQVRISDIKNPSAVPNFSVHGLPGLFSVESFFNKLVLPGDNTVAKQGNTDKCLLLVSDSKGRWVPIDMIYIDDPAATSRFTWLQARLKSKVFALSTQGPATEQWIRPLGIRFFDNLNKGDDQKCLTRIDRCEYRSIDPFTLAIT
ncbi:hypothetical protein FB567DRAFT_612030 [Paraphoma chrysanthemicola]|uniref:Uncharacterized protein n=1 Tax=Paraphoma chrysanthemicola TaxID=798071 RepID=A0A8K0VTR0_9PLEO|nr:hypothetical protein FB567DRAFT_612030 [Paraphoma chrysanthemicola]